MRWVYFPSVAAAYNMTPALIAVTVAHDMTSHSSWTIRGVARSVYGNMDHIMWEYYSMAYEQ